MILYQTLVKEMAQQEQWNWVKYGNLLLEIL